MNGKEYAEHVKALLADRGYTNLNKSHIEVIMAYWGAQEEFAPDPDDQAIVHMYEVLSMYDWMNDRGES